MITVNQIRRDIDKLREDLFNAELAIDFNRTIIKSFGNQTKMVTWADCMPSTNFEFATVGEYSWLLKKRQFSIVLFDGSILQISYTFKRTNLIEHRLCFYPFPFQLDNEEREFYQEMGLGLLEILEEAFSFKEFKEHLTLQSPIRFDFDSERAKEDHPASHLHLLRSECRIPVFAPLSIGHFVRFVFRRFYNRQWQDCDFLRNWPCEEFDRTVTLEQEKQLYMNRILEN